MNVCAGAAVPIIAFCGPKGAGKTTAAQMVVEFTEGTWVRYSFADPIRELLATLGVSRQQSAHPDTKDQPIDTLGGKTPRELMVSLGTAWGRQMVSEEIWLNQAARRIPRLAGGTGVEGVVIDDLRFDNEAHLINDLGGSIYEIQRPGHAYDPADPTETGITEGLILERIPAETKRDLARAMARLIAHHG